ncbi:MAG: hypothetical protein ABJA98_09250 [Acidobacteriota bacterium]
MPAESAPAPGPASQAGKSIGIVLDTLLRDMSLEAVHVDRLLWDRPIFVLRSASMERMRAFLGEILVHASAPKLHIMSHARDESAIRAIAHCDVTFYAYPVSGPYRLENVPAATVDRLQSVGFGTLFLLDAGTSGERLGDAEKLLAAIGEHGMVSFLADGTYAALSDWRQRRRAESAFLRLMEWYQLKLDPGFPDGPVLSDEARSAGGA